MKIAKRLLLVLAGLLVIVAVLFYGDRVRKAYKTYDEDLVGYVGLSIGASRDDALYLFGYPPEVVGEPEADFIKGFGQLIWDPRVFQVDGKDPKNAVPADKTINDYATWQWDRAGDGRLDVTFDPKTHQVTKIVCFVQVSRWDWECPRIFGVNTETHEDEVRKRLGEPSWVKHQGVSKSLGYDELGLVLTLTEQRVYMLEKHAAGGATWQWKLRHVFL